MSELEFFKGKVVCPRCNGNGLIYKAFIEKLKINLFICDECEATWLNESNINNKNFIDLSTFLDSKGSTYKDLDMQKQDFYWYKK
ncbi:3'-5' exonuclease [Chengkuizengella marina]|uniref:3'-5' exonuclease n=1 Tax=Chengkuizengella marina TaxID=2507566 RepID=A0A6N9Q782_9BACL|nr:3'-5' exonuclease [Chengkuizengella marina]NBI30726.1 3'-5' exonuclease [Chengkuizengella marina]